MNKQKQEAVLNRPATGTGSQDSSERSPKLPAYRNLVEAKHRMLGTAAYRGCGTHFPEHGHLHTRVPATERTVEQKFSANLSLLFLTILNTPSSSRLSFAALRLHAIRSLSPL